MISMLDSFMGFICLSGFSGDLAETLNLSFSSHSWWLRTSHLAGQPPNSSCVPVLVTCVVFMVNLLNDMLFVSLRERRGQVTVKRRGSDEQQRDIFQPENSGLG